MLHLQPTQRNFPGATLDGRTPVENGEEVAATLSSSQHLIIEGAGLSDPLFLSTPEILEAMESFLRGERVRSLRVQAPAVDFLAPRHVVTLSEELLDRYVGSYRINDEESRVVMRAGNLLWTQRGQGRVALGLKNLHLHWQYNGYELTRADRREASG